MKFILMILAIANVSLCVTPIYLEKEDITPCIVNLRNEKINMLGSGILIAHENRCFIATASHVARILNDSSDLIMKGDNDNPIKLKIIELSKNIPIKWRFHDKADVAILEITPRKNTINLFSKRFYPFEAIFDKLQGFSRDNQLTVFGFPEGLGAEGKFSPLTFRTYLASGLIAFMRADTKTPCEFYILENPGVGGYSGGPVIDLSVFHQGGATMRGNGTTLYGLMHSTISDATGGKLAAVTPSYFLVELLNEK
jgi:hypothetical protein